MLDVARACRSRNEILLARHLHALAEGIQHARNGHLERASRLLSRARGGLKRWKRCNLWSATLIDPYLTTVDYSSRECQGVAYIHAGRLEEARDLFSALAADHTGTSSTPTISALLRAYATHLLQVVPMQEGLLHCVAQRFPEARSCFSHVEAQLLQHHKILHDMGKLDSASKRMRSMILHNYHAAAAFRRSCELRIASDGRLPFAPELIRSALEHLTKAEAERRLVGTPDPATDTDRVALRTWLENLPKPGLSSR
jgi:hypothetical protein